MPRIAVDPYCVFISQSDAVHVIRRENRATITGRDVHRLHDRLFPHLQGLHDEQSVIAAVPLAFRSPVAAYLAKLRELGALRDVPDIPDGTDSRDCQFADDPDSDERAFSHTGRARVQPPLSSRVAHDERDKRMRVMLVRQADIGMLLMQLRGGRRKGIALTYVVLEEAAADGHVTRFQERRRRAYRQWLLNPERQLRGNGIRIELYALSENTGSLRRLFVLEGVSDHDLRTLPDQLSLVGLAEFEQIPLVIEEASHPYFADSVTVVGLTHTACRDQALRTMLSRARIRSLAEGSTILLRKGVLGASLQSYKPHVAQLEPITRFTIARTLPELQVALIEQAATNHNLSWRAVDLLQEPSSHPTVLLLREILRKRLTNLYGRAAKSQSGLFVYEGGHRRYQSFFRDKVLADTLLHAVIEEFYPELRQREDVIGAICQYKDFASPRDLSRLVHARPDVDRARPTSSVIVRSIRFWGISAWIGQMV